MIRFKQRLSNFEKAYAQFLVILDRDTKQDMVARTALIQVFEFTFELAWKSMKDLLESDGVFPVTPREVIQEAFRARYIEDSGSWAEALKNRNESSHAYDEVFAVTLEVFIRTRYFPVLQKLRTFFKSKL